MAYWLDLFTLETWDEFVAHGCGISGFSERRRGFAAKIVPGDVLVCYLGGGVKRFVAALEARSRLFRDSSPIWKSAPYPLRVKVRPAVTLTPETAVPISDLVGQLPMFKRLRNPRNWGWMFQGSPTLLGEEDGQLIVAALKRAEANPVTRPVEPIRGRKPVGGARRVVREVEAVAPAEEEARATRAERRDHVEIQWLLLKLGSDMGLGVWVARNDRNRAFDGHRFSDLPGMRRALPQQFDPVTNRIIELIDVLWLDGDAITCAFEVEHSSSVYSGILRMSDLLAMQPNLNMRLYLVAPDERRQKVIDELNRPTFAKARRPLPKVCKFIPYSNLRAKIQQVGSTARYVRPEFIDEIAEDCSRPPP